MRFGLGIYKMYLGIDPGLSGGIVFLNENEVHSTKMPTTDKDIWDLFNTHREISFAIIEKVHSMPGQGVVSMFKFGMIYGKLLMALTALEIPFEEVTPQKWQKALGIVPKSRDETKTEFKNRLKIKAQQLFPKEKVTLATSDALLIATYCQRRHEGRL